MATVTTNPHDRRATVEDYPTARDILDRLEKEETRSPLDPSNCCRGGDQGFRVYQTNLESIDPGDIEPGVLVYRPTTRPTAYRITSHPYTSEHGTREVHAERIQTTEDGGVKSVPTTLFLSMVFDKMTFMTVDRLQSTIC